MTISVCVAVSPGCVAMELGLAIPTPDNDADWTYVQEFVNAIINQLDIGRMDHQIQVGVATYRGAATTTTLSAVSRPVNLAALAAHARLPSVEFRS